MIQIEGQWVKVTLLSGPVGVTETAVVCSEWGR